jgi:hypothetical protein
MRIAFALGAALFAALAFSAPGAFGDSARDNILKAEAQIQALNPADANAASAADYETAQIRLGEAKAAEAKNKREESLWRSDEAAVQADIVQEKIKLRALDRTVSEIETGIETLRRELKS